MGDQVTPLSRNVLLQRPWTVLAPMRGFAVHPIGRRAPSPRLQQRQAVGLSGRAPEGREQWYKANPQTGHMRPADGKRDVRLSNEPQFDFCFT